MPNPYQLYTSPEKLESVRSADNIKYSPADYIAVRLVLDDFIQEVPSAQPKQVKATVLRPKRKITFEEEQTDV